MTVPVEARLWLGSVVVLGAGNLASLRLGNATDEVILVSFTGTNAASTRQRAEFGLTGLIGAQIPIGGMGVFFQARYDHGLTDPFDSGAFSKQMRDLVFMTGLRFSLGD